MELGGQQNIGLGILSPAFGAGVKERLQQLGDAGGFHGTAIVDGAAEILNPSRSRLTVVNKRVI